VRLSTRDMVEQENDNVVVEPRFTATPPPPSR
jgi:hypothetical protein